ncbi:MAG: hypothetical protein NVSMB1_01680 [Polyangiales bacterium]
MSGSLALAAGCSGDDKSGGVGSDGATNPDSVVATDTGGSLGDENVVTPTGDTGEETGAALPDGSQPEVTAGAFDGPVLYVANDDGSLYAIQAGTWLQLAKYTGLPSNNGVRGIDADPSTNALYIAHGSDALSGAGHLLSWDLMTHKPNYDTTYSHGIDQMAFGGGKIYMPGGEQANTSTWYVLDASNGMQVGTETGGAYPHNTLYQNGHRYYGGRQSNNLVVLGIGKGTVGPSPSKSAGVRPFTVNAAETRVWITWTRYRGFSVGNVLTGAIVNSVDFGPIPSAFGGTAPSHGITLSPDGTEVYVLDTPNNQVRVYDGTDNPVLKATVTLKQPIFPGTESPCAYDCARDGWLLHSRDGKDVYVGDSGDVIDTATKKIATNIAPLRNDRHGFLEVTWAKGKPSGTTTHFGRGY